MESPLQDCSLDEVYSFYEQLAESRSQASNQMSIFIQSQNLPRINPRFNKQIPQISKCHSVVCDKKVGRIEAQKESRKVHPFSKNELNLNQIQVTDLIQKYQNNDYPIVMQKLGLKSYKNMGPKKSIKQLQQIFKYIEQRTFPQQFIKQFEELIGQRCI